VPARLQRGCLLLRCAQKFEAWAVEGLSLTNSRLGRIVSRPRRNFRPLFLIDEVHLENVHTPTVAVDSRLGILPDLGNPETDQGPIPIRPQLLEPKDRTAVFGTGL